MPGNHDSRNVGYVHFEELFGDATRVLRKGGVTVVAVDSTEPDLDHGQIGRGRYVDREEFAPSRSDLRDLRLPPPSAARAGYRPRAERDLRRRRHDRVPATRRRAPRPFRPQACAVRVAAREPLRRQHGHRVVPAPAGKHEALLQRHRGLRAPRGDIWRRHPFHGQERIIQFSTDTFEYEKYTGRIESEVDGRAREGDRASSTASTTASCAMRSRAALRHRRGRTCRRR